MKDYLMQLPYSCRTMMGEDPGSQVWNLSFARRMLLRSGLTVLEAAAVARSSRSRVVHEVDLLVRARSGLNPAGAAGEDDVGRADMVPPPWLWRQRPRRDR